MRRIFTFVALSLLAVPLLFGCGGGGTNGGSGTLQVSMADAPLPNVTSLVIVIDRIEAHVNGDWVEVASVPQTIDLLDLVFTPMVVATGGLPVGSINQVRLFVSDATVTDDTGVHDVNIPSALNTGIKVNINASVLENTVTAILLDFNVEKSLHLLGNGTYQLQPVIPAVLLDLAGTVTGTVTISDLPVHGALIKAIYTVGPNYPIGTEVNTSSTSEEGMFKVWALLGGTYTIQATFTDPVTLVNYSVSVTDVVVSAGTNTDVGTMAMVVVP